MSRGFSGSVSAAKAQLQTTLAAGKVEIKRFFNWGIGFFTPQPSLDKTVGLTMEKYDPRI